MIEKVIEHFGNASRLADALGVHRSAVSQWVATGSIPPSRAIQIEKLTGGAFLAVDLFDEGSANDNS